MKLPYHEIIDVVEPETVDLPKEIPGKWSASQTEGETWCFLGYDGDCEIIAAWTMASGSISLAVMEITLGKPIIVHQEYLVGNSTLLAGRASRWLNVKLAEIMYGNMPARGEFQP